MKHYKTLISNLPVRQQCFTTKRTTWKKAENEIQWLETLNSRLFGDNKTLTISRQDIFETEDPRDAIIKTIYWGYPAGMRGNHFINILRNMDSIENVLTELKKKINPTLDKFKELTASLKGIPGLGISTYSKLLYFFKISFDSNPCLILDQRLIDVFARKVYPDFHQISKIRYSNAEKNYLSFLEISNHLANELETQGENIELFLFTFGKVLVPRREV